MKITPLCMLAAMRVPVLTNTFSDMLDIATMSVAQGGVTTLTLNTTHGLADGEQIGVSVLDAYEPNAIAAWEQVTSGYTLSNGAVVKVGDIVITTSVPHTLSSSPDVTRYDAWNPFVRFAGTELVGLDGERQMVGVPDEMTIIVRAVGVTLPGAIPATATVLERMERDIIGWHTATAVDEMTLTFPTPAGIARSYSITDPRIAISIRIWGGIDLTNCLSKLSRPSEDDNFLDGLQLDQGYMFVTPRRDTRLSRDRRSLSNATTQIMAGNFVRQELMDGFEIWVILPAEKYGGGVGCVDRCHGEVLTAVMRTFNGLKLPFTEFSSPNAFTSMMSGHRTAAYTKANYVHNYSFDATVYIGDADCALPIEVPDLYALDYAIQTGGDPPPAVNPQGTVPITKIIFDPGIYQKGKPAPLLATIPVDIE